MEKCYEYFGCQLTECIMQTNNITTPCWDTQGTLCNYSPLEVVLEENPNLRKQAACEIAGCLYYQRMNRMFAVR